MSFFIKTYTVTGHHGSKHQLTAEELYERVMRDKKSNYNWIAPARELVRICKETDFPADYAIAIKIAILNCFANLQHINNSGGECCSIHPADMKAVEYCYNSLYYIPTEAAISARNRYMTEIINTVSHIHILNSAYFSGPAFKKLCENWSNSKFRNYAYQKNINFQELLKSLQIDFIETVKIAEENEDFAEDQKNSRFDNSTIKTGFEECIL